MLLTDLLRGVCEVAGTLPPAIECRGLCTDSRLVRPGDAFIALAGRRHDGRQFMNEAAANGAVVALCEQPAPADAAMPAVEAPRLRDMLAALAERMYRQRAGGLRIIGVTGTNGKTTTTFLLREMLREYGCGLVGTLEYDLVSERLKALLTTPQVVENWRFLAAIREAGGKFAAMEVSSQGLDMGRVGGIQFDAAVFTNLTQDHLDYHGTMEAYLTAKLRLFGALQPAGLAIVNLDDAAAEKVLAAAGARKIGVTFTPTRCCGADLPARRDGCGAGRSHQKRGKESGNVKPPMAEQNPSISDNAVETYCAALLDNSLAGVSLKVALPAGGELLISSPLVGQFNAMNLLLAAACALELGAPADAVKRAAAGFAGAPGRMQRIEAGQPFLVVVDYSHTPDALEKALGALRPLGSGRLIVVFGCGGDRDSTKRPIMGAIASRLADVVVVTSDNPRSETPDDIIGQIVAGVAGRAHVAVEPDRRQAIRLAISAAKAGDIVLVAGKGHEDYQEIHGVRYPLDDRIEARAALAEAGYA